MNKCPFLLAADMANSEGMSDRRWDGTECMRNGCQLWNDQLLQCGLVAEAYLAGIKQEMKDYGMNPKD